MSQATVGGKARDFLFRYFVLGVSPPRALATAMFYSEFVLAKKSPLGNVWLAAHWTKKLTSAMIAKSDVVEACNSIIHPAAPLALRTSGHLLLGVVRIHDSKQKVLMTDCSNALVKIKVCMQIRISTDANIAMRISPPPCRAHTFRLHKYASRSPSDRAPLICLLETPSLHSMP